jgi:hypothetical protein
MHQTKIESLIESCINIASGFIISLLLWIYVVIPIWELEVTMLDNLSITALFTVSAIIRSYLWRRFFNAGLHKWIHRRMR